MPKPSFVAQHDSAITLTDGASIAVDASLGNYFRVTLGGNRTLSAPTNATDTQEIIIEVTQDATGTRTLAYTTGSAGAYLFGTDLPSPTISTGNGSVTVLKFVYHASKQRWLCIGVLRGF